jgi:hypothetical protein
MPVPKKVDIPAEAFDGMKVSKFEMEQVESEDEKALRLLKERLSFYWKGLGALGFAAMLVLATAVFCFVVLWNTQPNAPERQWAQTVLSAIVTGSVGYAFGKNSK